MAKGRFEIQKGGLLEGTKIIVDKETGVQYLFAWSGYAGGLTLLVDKEGKPILEKRSRDLGTQNTECDSNKQSK